MKASPMSFRRIALVGATAAAALLGACSDATAPVSNDGLPRNLDHGIYPLVAVASQTSDAAQVELYLKRVPDAVKLSSFQGELTYDPNVLALEHTDLPPGVIGSTNETSPGHVRFAGAGLDGLGDVPVLALRFTRRGEIRRESFGVKVEELTDAQGFADLTALVSGGMPFFHVGSTH